MRHRGSSFVPISARKTLGRDDDSVPKGLNRPRDPVQLAATIIGLATGQITEDQVDGDRTPKRGAGGLKGGKARAKALTAARRTEIAHAGAQARWGKRAAAATTSK